LKLTTENHVKALVKQWFDRHSAWHYGVTSTGMGMHGVPDRIGCVPVLVTPEMVGKRVGLLVGVECKRPGRRGEKNRGMSVHQFNHMEAIRNASGLSICCDGQEDLDELNAEIIHLMSRTLH